MAIPQKGDQILRTEDGRTYTIEEVIEAGGENLYRIRGSDETIELPGAAFVKEHDQDRAPYEVVPAPKD